MDEMNEVPPQIRHGDDKCHGHGEEERDDMDEIVDHVPHPFDLDRALDPDPVLVDVVVHLAHGLAHDLDLDLGLRAVW